MTWFLIAKPIGETQPRRVRRYTFIRVSGWARAYRVLGQIARNELHRSLRTYVLDGPLITATRLSEGIARHAFYTLGYVRPDGSLATLQAGWCRKLNGPLPGYQPYQPFARIRDVETLFRRRDVTILRSDGRHMRFSDWLDLREPLTLRDYDTQLRAA